jgi:hypothetical protein
MRTLAESLSASFGVRVSYSDKHGNRKVADASRLSVNAKRAIAKYGRETCLQCFEWSKREGASSIANGAAGVDPGPHIRTTQQADAAINAGAELAEGRK